MKRYALGLVGVLLLSGCGTVAAETSNYDTASEAMTITRDAEIPRTRDPLRVNRSVERKAPAVVKKKAPAPAPVAKPQKPAYKPVAGALTAQELVAVLSAAGFRGDGLRLAWAIAMRESMGRPSAHNQNSSTGDNSYGLFQINMIGSLGAARAAQYGLSSYSALLDPRVNARVAFAMSGGGKNFGAWGVGPDSYAGAPSSSTLDKWLSKFPG